MGYYTGVYDNLCPRCNVGEVHTVFISVGSMSYSEGCGNCGATDFTDAEKDLLGDTSGTSLDPKTGQWVRFKYPEPVILSTDEDNDPALD